MPDGELLVEPFDLQPQHGHAARQRSQRQPRKGRNAIVGPVSQDVQQRPDIAWSSPSTPSPNSLSLSQGRARSWPTGLRSPEARLRTRRGAIFGTLACDGAPKGPYLAHVENGGRIAPGAWPQHPRSADRPGLVAARDFRA